MGRKHKERHFGDVDIRKGFKGEGDMRHLKESDIQKGIIISEEIVGKETLGKATPRRYIKERSVGKQTLRKGS